MDLVGNPEDRFSHEVAHMFCRVKNLFQALKTNIGANKLSDQPSLCLMPIYYNIRYFFI